MKKRIISLILSFIFLTSLTGCWDYNEYENMAQITAIGIDYNNETKETTLTFQYIASPKNQGNNQQGGITVPIKKGRTVSATDKTLYGAIEKLQQVIMKRLFYGYIKVVLVGEEAARYKMKDIVEFLDRVSSIRPTAYLAISSSKAETVLSISDPVNVSDTGDHIYRQIQASEQAGASFSMMIQDFNILLAVGGIEATAPYVIVTSKVSTEPEAQGGTENNIRFDEIVDGNLMVSGMAAFKKDKLAGFLNVKETMGYGWISNKKVFAYKNSEASIGDDIGNVLYYRVENLKSRIKIDIKDGEPVAHVKVSVIAGLRKYYSNQGEEFITPEVVKSLEEKLDESIRSDIEAALEKCQREYETDIFGFGLQLFRTHKKLWQTKYEKEWDEVFPKVPVYVEVESKIINTGTNLKRFIIK